MFAEITVIITHFVSLQMISDLSWQEPIYVEKKNWELKNCHLYTTFMSESYTYHSKEIQV